MTQQTEQPDSIIGELTEYMAGALEKPLPAEVAEKAKHHILDTLAAMVSGSRLKPGLLATAYVRGQGGSPEALVAGSDVVTSAVNAALANGMLAHADETDDSHQPSLTHPGCGIVPAALAMAEREGRDGAALLRAVVLGYDIGTRTTMALGWRRITAASRSSHALGSLFGAAAAAGALAGLTAGQMRWVLSYTAQQASGLGCWVRDEEHVEKSFDFGGMGARNGVAAATMVQAGCTGVDDVFDGPNNFFQAFSSEPEPREMVRGLGTEFEIMRTNIKKWCVGSPAQAAMDAVMAIMAEHRVGPVDLERMVVRLDERGARTVDDRLMPDINGQYLLAVTMLDGTLTFEAAHDFERMSDPPVLALRRRIDLVGDPALNDTSPPRQGIVEFNTRDGRTLTHRVYAVRGTADNPMTRDEVEAKAIELMAGILGPDRARKLAQQVWELEDLRDARDLRPLLQA